MLATALSQEIASESSVTVRRSVAGEDFDRRNVFAFSDTVVLELNIPRRLGVCSAELAVTCDRTGHVARLPLVWEDMRGATDIYRVEMHLCALCENEPGLLLYTLRLHRAEETLYLAPINNIDFRLTYETPDVPFRLLVYADDYKTPDWAKSAVMYHIFVDRFAKSEPHALSVRDDARLNPDWDNGIPEFAPYPGAPLKNNEFFGGSLYGILEKLDYLEDLGVNLLYLSPIFKAYSNHKYDTGDYGTVDEMFGGREALRALLCETRKRGMRVILDGVFNHTGDDSLYFNRYGNYPSVGAHQSPDSPYRDWYFFRAFPDEYECWWGIPILPKLNNENPATKAYFLGETGILRRYLAEGTDGWRLDVADELPSAFLTELREAVKTEKNDALILGEVWENAADKVAYGKRRSYLSGGQLDSVMNYPFKNAVLDYIRTRDCRLLYDTVTEILSMYPPQSAAVLMNLLGTHDTERILTALGATDADYALSNDEKSRFRLSEERRKHAERLLKLASVLEFTLPGFPSIFYGDEVGMEGFGDPFCRRPYPWGRENGELRAHYRLLAHIKREKSALHSADLTFLKHEGASLAFVRRNGMGKRVAVLCNMAPKSALFQDKLFEKCAFDILYGACEKTDGGFRTEAESAVILAER